MSNTAYTLDPDLLKEPDSHVAKNQRSVVNTVKDFMTISRLLRLTGALTVIASMSALLLQEWAIGSDMDRFYLLLAQTVLLAAGGCGLSFLLKENKGARVFFNLSLLSITATMTTLGALIFSTVQWSSGLTDYPSLAHWQAPNFIAMIYAMVSAFLAAIPIALFSYAVMARPLAKSLTCVFLLSNLLLLIPVRDSFSIGLLTIGGMLLPFMFLRKRMFQHISLRTLEGR